MLSKKALIPAGILLTGVLLVAGYNRPYRWWPINEMSEQDVIKPYHINGLIAPPEGATAVDQPEPVPPRLEIDQVEDFKNPIAPSPESIAVGKELFDTYCISCHGPEMTPDMDRKSPVQKAGMPGADINLVKLRSDAHIFATLTYGSAIMKRQSTHLSPEERWHVVNYIRSIANKSE